MSISYHVYLFCGYKIDRVTTPIPLWEKARDIFHDDDARNANGKSMQLIYDQMGGKYFIIGKRMGDVDPEQECGELHEIDPSFISEHMWTEVMDEIDKTYPEFGDLFADKKLSLFMISHAW